MLGVIGGTGLYELPGLDNIESVAVETPFGSPSAPIITGTIHGHRVAFLARHGAGHVIGPTELPFRANIWALKSLGVTHLLSVSAVGSLQANVPPRMAVVPDQIIDRTVGRTEERTYFSEGIVAHVGLADPFCASLRHRIVELARGAQDDVHDGGTYICIEGPQFSTRAESRLYRQWGCDVIGMTAMPEARLAREAGMCFGILAMVTDFDVWNEDAEDVSYEAVMRVLADNVATGQAVVAGLAADDLPACNDGCQAGASAAITTRPDVVPAGTRERLKLLLAGTALG